MSKVSTERNTDCEKKGLMVISFGTSCRESRIKTINAIEKDLRKAFPDRLFCSGWTSHMLTAKVRKNEGSEVMTAEEAVKFMEREGITDLLVQPTHLTDGIENKRLREILEKSSIKTIRLGRPLLTGESDLIDTGKAISQIFSEIHENQVVALMGHGSPDRENTIYLELENKVRTMGRKDIFIGTVEGNPGIEHIKEGIRASRAGKVLMAPLMVVAGDHAINDLAGDKETSWKAEIMKMGCETIPYLHGLGESEEIRQIYIKHAQEAECIK